MPQHVLFCQLRARAAVSNLMFFTPCSLENTRECVVCLSDLKDTAVLPCRHMCLCSQCAEQLRHQSNRCPICRQRTLVAAPRRKHGASTHLTCA